MTSLDIRQQFLDFFKKKGHIIIPSFSIVPENDSSTLFTSSGMQPLVSYLMGEKHPCGVRLVNSQKCFRAEDIDKIGNNRYTTFFEMLGNWSLGDYFKKEQLFWIYSFLIEELGLDIKRLYATVFRGSEEIGVSRDIESVNILKQIFAKYGINAKDIDFSEKNGMQDGRIFYYSTEKNWWSRFGSPDKMPIGEIGGPDSEIFYDLGADLKKHENSIFKDKPCHVNCDCGRFIEIGNSVFIEFKRTKTGFEKLKQYNVDFGGGLERITMVCQGFDNIFKTDFFIKSIKKIEELSNKKYNENYRYFEIIADHMRAICFIMGDNRGIAPSNTEQGYLVRRLIRRVIRCGKNLGITTNFWLALIAEIIIKHYADIYPELKNNKNFILKHLKDEEEKFSKTIEKGLKQFEKIAKRGEIDGQSAFHLYDTYGFPLEMTEEIAMEKGLKVDKKGFEQAFKKHQEISRAGAEKKFGGVGEKATYAATKLHTATHLLHSALRKILGKEVKQMGSDITSERLRFDFSFGRKITEEEIKKIENLVNQKINENLKVKKEEMEYEKAVKNGALAFFKEKYPQKVTVYSILNSSGQIFSKEICAGPHIKQTSELGFFKILKQESSGTGVRRIKAVLK